MNTPGFQCEARNGIAQLEKFLRYKSHTEFIETCIQEDIIPHGFQLKWNMQMEADTDIILKCEKIKRNASLQLMQLTAQACRKKVSMFNMDSSFKTFIEKHDQHDINRKIISLRNQKYNKLVNIKRSNTDFHYKDIDFKDFNLRRVTSDGNCFYRCVSLSFYGSEKRHISVRKRVVNHMLSDRNKYLPYIDGDILYHIQEQSYSDGRESSWATEAELYATATVYNANIHVFKIENGVEMKLVFSPLNHATLRRHIFLRLENEHFNYLESKRNHISKNGVPEESYENNHSLSYFDWFDMKHVEQSDKLFYTESTVGLEKSVKNVNIDKQHGMDKNVKNDSSLSMILNSKSSQKENRSTKQQNSQVVITNLSSRKFEEVELSLLAKGLSFVPTRNKIDMIKIHSDLAEWERRMRLKEYFYDKKESNNENFNEEPWDKKGKSFFTPDPGRDKHLDTYIEEVKKEIINGIHDRCTPNISKAERKAIKTLLNDNSIVIRPADKGSGIVIVNTEDYISNLETEMTNSDSYTKTEGGAHIRAEKEVKKIVNKMFRDGLISKKLKEYLIQKRPVNGKLKGNPKIHKQGNPYRTIVSGIGTATERMAEVSEKELNEFVENTPSYIKDTTDFLNKLQEVSTPVREGTILFCFDIVKLYPSIPRKEGLSACEEALQERTKTSVAAEAVMKMITTVLTNNVFEFHDNEYIQNDGVAIGSKLGRNFACCYMRKWDEKLMLSEYTPCFYKRYIDDGFGLWQHGVDRLIKFKDFANSIHPNIKVELRWNSNKIEFLDTWVKIEDGKITTDLYTKPTDKHLYVNWKSDHPKNVKKAIPYGLGVRLKRICTKNSDYIKHRQNLKHQLRVRGYNGRFIERQLKRVDVLDREKLLRPGKHRTDKKDRIPLVITYSKHLPNLHEIIYKHISILQGSERMNKIFSDAPIVAYRRDTNLHDLLVHGKTNRVMNKYNTSLREKNDRCSQKCKVCDMLERGIHNMEIGIEGPIERIQRCESWNVIYGIHCVKCKKVVYVGETSRTLKERLKEHDADIRLKREKPVSEHFNKPDHKPSDVGVSILEQLKEDSRHYRQIKELDWIQRLKTESPNGLNTKVKVGILWREYK